MKKKLTLSEIRVKSFTTGVRAGQGYDQVVSKPTGICTCLMFCNSEPRLCTDDQIFIDSAIVC